MFEIRTFGNTPSRLHPLPSGKLLQFAIENGPVEIVDLPSYKMVIFHSYVNDQRV